MKDDDLDRLFGVGDDLAGEAPATPPGNKQTRKERDFAIVPLDGDWGYRAVTVAGAGAAIVLYAIRKGRLRDGNGYVEVPITAAVCERLGINRKTRGRAIDRLVEAGFATVRRRGKFQGCPLLTLKVPPGA
jgi:hypothetical protein